MRRVKPTIETAGDLALAELLRARLRERLRQQMGELAARASAPPAISTRAAAAEWIFDHGGTIAAALKATHPDTGGNSEDFQRTMEARAVLEKRP